MNNWIRIGLTVCWNMHMCGYTRESERKLERAMWRDIVLKQAKVAARLVRYQHEYSRMTLSIL